MPAPPSGTVTFLFTDIEGSTRLWDTQREAMTAALARHDALLRIPQPRAALDIGEQERHRAARQSWDIYTMAGGHSGFRAGHEVRMVVRTA